MNDELVEFEDVAEAVREGRSLRTARVYGVRIAKDDLNFRSVALSDPVPLGRQIIEAGGFKPVGAFSLFGILRSGDFEDVRLDEPFDLRQRGAERFVVFQTDRSFKLRVNDSEVAWGKPLISGNALYALANAADDAAVFLEIQGGDDQLIERDALVDLGMPGIERFVTAPRHRKFEIIVNARPHVVGRHVTFEEIVQLAFPGPHVPTIVFSMTYRHAASQPHAGELGPGGSVKVKNGTIFNVTRTDKS